MSTESLPLMKQKEENLTVWGKIEPHLELILAVISGALILSAWILDQSGLETWSVSLYITAFVIGGFFKAKEGIEESIADRELNVEMLMVFAAVGSGIIGYWTEGAILIFIFAVSGALETYTMNRSHKEISALMDIQPQQALRIHNGVEETVHVSELGIGDIIRIKPGERVPADAEIVSGETTIDQAAITGESIPVEKQYGDEIYAGTVNVKGSITAKITKHASETLFQKIINLVQSAQSEKSPSQQFIERFEGQYVKGVLLVVILMMFLPHFLLGWSWTDTFYRAMVLLVVASPCALVASIMPASLAAISNGARQGILFKGGVHLERLSTIKAIAFDKTGTLTKGKPEVIHVKTANNMKEEEILLHMASIENQSNHPLAQSIVRYVKRKHGVELIEPERLEDVSGCGVQASIGGAKWKIGKRNFVGEEKATSFSDGVDILWAKEGATIVYAMKEDEIVGMLALKDVVREDTMRALQTLKDEGIYTIMITGDSAETAQAIANETHVDEFISECLPEEKVTEVKKLLQKYGSVAMVGDGINDAPALATASVGIAMGEGTDVALETADIVLMKNDLPRIAEAIRLSKKMRRIVKQNIAFSLAVITLLVISNFLQLIDLPFGVIGHEGSTILVILNGLRLLR
ncbi:ATPase [Bacillus coahuilensis m2-6]|uniref:heavy metal translocating P-type ATPase n=1 Tax=Bacillus coahuilensis TaxID=408580 RepID=UPI00075063B1|nr:heavy metal translocating P-type ATPase [Bacillus coahuilensis]KUP09868.1 ATPase [Bacillus coahuilensis m2-6]